MTSTLLRTGICLIALSLSASAQNNANPFGSDPFGGGPNTADPFGDGGAGADPFADGPAANPFGQRKAQPAKRPAKPKQAASVKRSPAESEARIRSALGDMTSQSFIELPLADVARVLSEAHDIPIVVNSRALEEIGLSPDEPFNLSLNNVTLRSFLRLGLHSYDLTYLVQDEVLQITTPEYAARSLVLQTYRIPDSLADNPDELLKALTTTVTPDEWQEKGGPCAVAVLDSVLVVSASEYVHESVRDFWEKVQIGAEGE